MYASNVQGIKETTKLSMIMVFLLQKKLFIFSFNPLLKISLLFIKIPLNHLKKIFSKRTGELARKTIFSKDYK